MSMYRLNPDDRSMRRFRSAPLSDLYKESDLEDWLEQNPDVVTDGEPILIIARQPPTPGSGTPDLIGLDADGNTVIIELKRGRTPRDVVAQALEYAAWLDGLDREAVTALADDYLRELTPPRTLAPAWREAFAPEKDDEANATLPIDVRLNEHQRVILVLEGGDERTEAVVRYLRRLGVGIGLVEYRFYRIEGGEQILDVQTRVGRELPVTAGVSEQPSEQKLLAHWPETARQPYLAFRNVLLERDPLIMPEPKKSAVSFYKRTPDGRVYMGSYSGSSPREAKYWFRKDSLEDRMDVPAAIAELKRRIPDGVVLNDQWVNDCSFRIPASESHTRQVAELVVEEIAERIE